MKFEVVPIATLKTKIPGRLLPIVQELKGSISKLRSDQGGRLSLERGERRQDVRNAVKIAAASMNKRVQFPFRSEDGSLSFYLQSPRGRRKGAAKASGRRVKQSRSRKAG